MVGFLFVSLDSLCPLTRSSGRSTLMFLPMRSALRLRRRFLLFSCLPSSLPFCCFLRMPADSSLMRRLSHNPLHEMLACFWRRCEPQSQVRSLPFPEFTRSRDTRSWQRPANSRSPGSLGHTALPCPLRLVVIARVLHVRHICVNHRPNVVSQTHWFRQLLSELVTEGGRNVVRSSLPAIRLFGRTQPLSGALDFSLRRVLLYLASRVGPAGGGFRPVVARCFNLGKSSSPSSSEDGFADDRLSLDRRFAHAAHGLRACAGPAQKSPSVPRRGRISPSQPSGCSPRLRLSAFSFSATCGFESALIPIQLPGHLRHYSVVGW